MSITWQCYPQSWNARYLSVEPQYICAGPYRSPSWIVQKSPPCLIVCQILWLANRAKFVQLRAAENYVGFYGSNYHFFLRCIFVSPEECFLESTVLPCIYSCQSVLWFFANSVYQPRLYKNSWMCRGFNQNCFSGHVPFWTPKPNQRTECSSQSFRLNLDF